MLALEQLQTANGGELKEQEQTKRSYKNIERPEETAEYGLSMAIYKRVEKALRGDALNKVTKIEEDYKTLSDGKTAGKMIDELLAVIELGCKDNQKIIFGMPYEMVHGIFSEEERKHAVKKISLIGRLIKNKLFINEQIEAQNLSLEENEKAKLSSLDSKISNLIREGTYVDKEILNTLKVDPSILEERSQYLSRLEQIACNSIENDPKEGVMVERDNAFYCVKFPENSIVTPAKFMDSPEFKDLEYGAIRIGEGDDIIRLYDGKYHDMKGRVKMTFNIGGEVLEMALSSAKADRPDNALNVGAITVYMDDKNCEIFSKYYKDLEKVPRISKVVASARSFVQRKNGEKGSLQFTFMENISSLRCSNCDHQIG